MFGDDLFSMIELGGVVMYPLFACSVVSVAVVLERIWVLMRAARSSERLQHAVASAWSQGGLGDVRTLALRDASPLATIFRAALADCADYHGAAELRDRVARRHLAEVNRALKRYVWLLGTIGSLAPFIGLFGTVLGIIRSFESMAATGAGGFAVVAAGISEALIATAGGLLVGVLAIFAYNAMMVRIGNIAAQWRDWTDELLVRIEKNAQLARTQDPSVI